jgi:PadR family transcriptional regulator, regulatory protein AphA
MELSNTAYVILGLLSWRPMSGYEIKSLVDNSTRFFWAASYGQIYPELRHLSEAGLIEGKASPQGGRKRNVYRLTATGRRELRSWLAVEPDVYELRDEGLLKLFFADASGGKSAPGTLDAMRHGHQEIVGRLREIEASGPPEGYAYLVLRYGIEFHEWIADWCERTKRGLEDEAAPKDEAATTRRTV